MRLWLLVFAFGCKDDLPALPPPPPVVADAAVLVDAAPSGGNTVRGRVTLGDAPVAKLALEACAMEHASLYATTMCARSTDRRLTRTDAHGAFTFASLPDGKLGIFVLEAPHHTYTIQFSLAGGGRVQDIAIPVPATPPAAADPRGRNRVQGQLVHRGRPLAYVALELCKAHRRTLDHETPCWRTPPRAITRTDADGRFTFPHVPDGDHQIVVLERPWYPRMVFALGLAGEVRDLGVRRMSTDEHRAALDHDDEAADQWPDIRRQDWR